MALCVAYGCFQVVRYHHVASLGHGGLEHLHMEEDLGQDNSRF